MEALFRDPEHERREAGRMKGTKELVRCAFGDPEIPDYREVEITVYPFGLGIRDAHRGIDPETFEPVTMYVVSHLGTGYAVGPMLEKRADAVLLCYMLRDLDWAFDRPKRTPRENRLAAQAALKEILGDDEKEDA